MSDEAVPGVVGDLLGYVVNALATRSSDSRRKNRRMALATWDVMTAKAKRQATALSPDVRSYLEKFEDLEA